MKNQGCLLRGRGKAFAKGTKLEEFYISLTAKIISVLKWEKGISTFI